MNQARYLFRMDDITPTMNWDRFWAVMNVFQAHSIKPLLGVVPDNRDSRLDVQAARADFWDIMRQLRREEAADFAQHGYQHVLTPIKQRSGLSFSEFAGFRYEEQLRRIAAGKAKLHEEGMGTSYWISPQHMQDGNTIRALKQCGFTALSDGSGIFPFRQQGLVCVPQQFWRPRTMPFGIFTILLHTNDLTDCELESIEAFLKRPLQFTSFSREVSAWKGNIVHQFTNSCFSGMYKGLRIASGRNRRRSSRELDIALESVSSQPH